MQIYHSPSEFNAPNFSVVTTGTFDGVHLGHRVIIDRVNQIARKHDGESVMLTFHPHPRKVLFPETKLQLLTTIEEKTELLKQAGIDHLVIVPFTRDFSRTTATEYVRDLLVDQLQVKKLIIGYDHQFGRNREGSLQNLQECAPAYGFDVEEIPAQEIDAVKISSTKIRRAIEDGDLATANKYLGYAYGLTGKVEKGKQLGRTLGYPTANINIENSQKLIPKNGVYAAQVQVEDKRFKAMVNIGVKPTVQNSDSRSLEAHLFEFKQELYEQNVRVSLVQRLRSEKKFTDMEALKNQLHLDKQQALEVLA